MSAVLQFIIIVLCVWGMEKFLIFLFEMSFDDGKLPMADEDIDLPGE